MKLNALKLPALFATKNTSQADRALATSLMVSLLILAGCNRAGTSGGGESAAVTGENLAALLPNDAPRLVFLFNTCTVNKQYLGLYNDSVAYTPNLDKFARESMVFDKHRTEAGFSGISFASLFSGKQAPGHGAFTHPNMMSDRIYTVAEAFRDSGYQTYAWFSHNMVKGLNYDQGVPELNRYTQLLNQRSAFDGISQIVERVAGDKSCRALITTAFTVTHSPYSDFGNVARFWKAHPGECQIIEQLGERQFEEYTNLYRKNFTLFAYDFTGTVRDLALTPEKVQQLAAVVEVLYKSDVYQLDQLFGTYVDQIGKSGLQDEAVILFTADHGESMYKGPEQFNWSHGCSLDAEVLDVPLMIRFGSGGPRGHYEHVTRNIDVFPTLAGMIGMHLPADVWLEGTDLSAAIRGQQPAPELLAFSHTGCLPAVMVRREYGALREKYYPSADIQWTWVAVRKGDRVWKMSRRGGASFEFEAFDLAVDPAETTNCFDSTDAEHQAMAEQLVAYKENLVAGYKFWTQPQAGQVTETDSQMLNRLKSLGYVK